MLIILLKNLKNFDAIVLCGGATKKEVLPTKGIDAKGVVQAMDFLTQQTKIIIWQKIRRRNNFC